MEYDGILKIRVKHARHKGENVLRTRCTQTRRRMREIIIYAIQYFDSAYTIHTHVATGYMCFECTLLSTQENVLCITEKTSRRVWIRMLNGTL